jgi:hypothetical protein
MLMYFVRLGITAVLIMLFLDGMGPNGWFVVPLWKLLGWEGRVNTPWSLLPYSLFIAMWFALAWFTTSPNGLGQVRRLKFNFGVPIALPNPRRRRVRRMRAGVP